MEEIKDEESWNKKRIFGALLLIALLIIGGYFLKTKFLAENLSPQDAKLVKGTSVKNEDRKEEENKASESFNIKEAVKEKIDSLKQEVAGLNILEVASSSPQIQKIINDIKSLEEYPKNQAKELCQKICTSF